MATRETAAADSNVSGQRRCDRAMAMALQGRDGETWVASEQIQRGRKRAMEMRATAIKAGRRRHKWAMVQAMAMVMYCKGLSFYNLIINKDGPWMLARWCDNDERQFELPPSSNTVSLRRISFFSEIHSPRSVTPFFSKTPHFPLNQIKLPLRRSPSWLVCLKESSFNNSAIIAKGTLLLPDHVDLLTSLFSQPRCSAYWTKSTFTSTSVNKIHSFPLAFFYANHKRR